MSGQLPLTPGDRGEAVRDLQRRLASVGFGPQGFQPAAYCSATERAVADFQASRGLHQHGRCDADTWRTLVEASWRLGDRLLMLTAPHLRGDDVNELQALLSRVGFDAGRVDGIFGVDTVRALEDYQRNAGLVTDGVCGPATLDAIAGLLRTTGTGPGVTLARESATWSASELTVADLRIVIGQFGGLSSLTRLVVLALRQRGATVISSDEPDARAQAAMSNHFGADIYVGFEVTDDATVCFYRVPQFESRRGRTLAESIAEHCGASSARLAPTVEGMRLAVLRETRMPAVLVGVRPHQLDWASQIAHAVVEAIETWTVSPGHD